MSSKCSDRSLFLIYRGIAVRLMKMFQKGQSSLEHSIVQRQLPGSENTTGCSNRSTKAHF